MSTPTITVGSRSVDVSVGGSRAVDVSVGTVGPRGPEGPAGPAGPPGITPKFWAGTQAEYDALGAYDSETMYIIENP